MQLELTNLGGVIRRAKDELGRTIVARADIRNIGLIGNEDLGASKITELQHTGIRVEQQILRFDVTMADSL